MPAVTVQDTTTLPKILPPLLRRERALAKLTTAPSGYEGEGFPVRRAFAGVDLGELDPFIHMDQLGEVEYAPGEPKGTPWHPHRGFETVTYIIDGAFEHQDSTGGGGLITNGDTQWMTAGSGILHIERPPEGLVVTGGLFHGVQLWVNLPSRSKLTAPKYQDLRGDESALGTTTSGGALIRVIAGEMGELRGPGSTQTPITVAHLSIAAGAEAVLPWDPRFNCLAYVLAGKGLLSAARVPAEMGQLGVFGPGDTVVITAAERQETRSPMLEVLLLGGAPIGEPVAWMGPFVMNTKAELAQAYEEFRAGRLGSYPAASNS